MEVKASSPTDIVVEEFNKTEKDWGDAYVQTLNHIRAIEEYGKSRSTSDDGNSNKKKDSLPRLKGLAQDGLAMLTTELFNLDLLAPQLPTDDHVQNALLLLQSWNNQIQSLRSSLRDANLQATANMRKAAQEERELLLGGGEESTVRRTTAGMTSAAESITESLRRTRQLMVQEVERSGSTLMASGSSLNLNLNLNLSFLVILKSAEESTGVLKKAESEYKGHRSLLMRTRNLLSTMKRQDVLDRIILLVGFLLFSLAVLYVVSKRIGILKLQRKVVSAIKAGMAGEAEIVERAGVDAINHLAQVNEHADVDLEQRMHDEL